MQQLIFLGYVCQDVLDCLQQNVDSAYIGQIIFMEFSMRTQGILFRLTKVKPKKTRVLTEYSSRMNIM